MRSTGADMVEHASAAPSAYPARAAAWYSVIVLAIVYLFSVLDRQVLVLLVEPLKADLHISDTQVSLLTGSAFALLYSVLAVPMGWAADRYPRKWIIASGVVLWSVMTVGCGMARSFGTLFVARMGVGIGEATLTPAAHGMIPDLFPPERLARGMAVFAAAGAVGLGFALLIGSAVLLLAQHAGAVSVPLLGELRGWQFVLVIVGLLTLLTPLLIGFMTDPPRREHGGGDARLAVSAFAYMFARRGVFLPLMLAVTALNMLVYGASAWIPSILIRRFAVAPAQVGATLGLLLLIGIPASIFGAAWLSDRLRSGGRVDAPLLVFIGCMPVTVLGYAVAAFAGDYRVALGGIIMAQMAGAVLGPLAPTAFQYITIGGMRSQVSAIWLLVANLAGIGLGPTIPAAIADYGFHNERMIGVALFLFASVAAGLAAAAFAICRRGFVRLSLEVAR